MPEFSKDTYKSAMEQVNGNAKDTPALEEQRLAAEKREMETKNGINLSQNIARDSAKFRIGDQAEAKQLLKFGLDDFSTPAQFPVAGDQTNKVPKITENGVKGVFPEVKTNTPTETNSASPAGSKEGVTVTVDGGKQMKDANDKTIPTDTIKQEVKSAQDAIKSGNPDQMKDVLGNMGKLFSSLPQGMQNFFKGLLELFGINIGNINSNSKETEQAKVEKLKYEEQKKILDSYGVKIETPNKGTNVLTLMPNAKVEGLKTPKANEGNNTGIITEKLPITGNKDGTLSINYDKANSVDIKENQNGFVLTVNNKDGSIDTYAVKSDKKTIETPKV